MRKKLILFDWGNIVESHTTGYSCINAWSDLFYECGYRGDENIFYLLGKYRLSSIKNTNEFEKVYKLMKEEFKFNKSFEEFVGIYKRIFDKIDYYKDVACYEVSLRDRCYIGILSDLTIFDKERLNRQVNLSLYDYVFLSFELGMKKPDMEIFNKVQSMLPFAPKDILFIDDRKDNIESAIEIGWNTLHVTGLELDKIKNRCEEFIGEE